MKLATFGKIDTNIKKTKYLDTYMLIVDRETL